MNKTKKQLYEENKKLKKEKKMLDDWLYDKNENVDVDKLVNKAYTAEKLSKIMIFVAIMLLISSAFMLGVAWNWTYLNIIKWQ